MSPRRPDVRLPFAGKVDPETGRKLCVWCGTIVQGRRIRWCSDDCVLDYQLARGDQNAARRFLRAKEKGVCQLCRVDTRVMQRKFRGAVNLPKDQRDQCRWDADHIIPIVEGGKLDRTNLRTVCRRCHKVVTKELHARLAARRKTRV